MKQIMTLCLITNVGIAIAGGCCGKNNPPPPPAPVVPKVVVRTPDHPVNMLFVTRWSSRAMSGQEVSQEELNMLFEAARWAPSSFNEQPWHFLYAVRSDPYWQDFFNLLDPFNQQWVEKAGALIVVLSRGLFSRNGEKNVTHSYDVGAAWAQLALQGYSMGLVVHGMAGFDYQRTREELRIPECYTIEAMIAVGKKGTIEDLPEGLRDKEILSERKKVEDFVTRGPYLSC